MSYIDVKEVGLLNEDGQLINPAQDETIILLRRLLQQSQSLANRDSAGIMRINFAGQDAGMNITNFGSVAAVNQITDWARTSYNTGIRANLIFS